MSMSGIIPEVSKSEPPITHPIGMGNGSENTTFHKGSQDDVAIKTSDEAIHVPLEVTTRDQELEKDKHAELLNILGIDDTRDIERGQSTKKPATSTEPKKSNDYEHVDLRSLLDRIEELENRLAYKGREDSSFKPYPVYAPASRVPPQQSPIVIERRPYRAEEAEQRVVYKDREDSSFRPYAAYAPVAGTPPQQSPIVVEKYLERRRSSTSSASLSESEQDDEEVNDIDDGPACRRLVPAVKECNWEQFKNRFGPDDKDYVLECLVAGDQLEDFEIANEQWKRSRAEEEVHTTSAVKTEYSTQKHRARNDKSWNNRIKSFNAEKDTEKRWLQRIRVNSAPIIRRLGQALGETWNGQPRTFFRPFGALVRFHEHMKKELQDLEKRLEQEGKISAESIVKGLEEPRHKKPEERATAVEETSKNTAEIHNPAESIAEAAVPIDDEVDPVNTNTMPRVPPVEIENFEDREWEQSMNTKEAWEDMRCYVEFVEGKLMPLYKQFDEPDESVPEKIRFEDLWYLFRLGEHIYVPNAAKDSTRAETSKQPSTEHTEKQPTVDQRIWRLYCTALPNLSYVTNYKPLRKRRHGRFLPPDTSSEKDKDRLPCFIHCYYLEYNGESYGPIVKRFDIEYFRGEKSIRELEVYPLRFCTDRDAIRKEYQDLGGKFVQYLTERPLAHNGWTVTTDPEGYSIDDANGQEIKYPDYVDSDVIVDFKEAFQTYPPWKPGFDFRGVESYILITENDKFHFIRWSDTQRTETLGRTTEKVIVDDLVVWIERNEYVEKDPYLKEGSGKIHSDEDLLILPRRMFAYALRERRFVHVDVRFLSPIIEHQDAFNSLRIDLGHRRTIQSVVSSHFRNKKIEKMGRELRTQDLIRGKGRGLIVLLHGVPGVGKTATAEAVAQAYRKPLFSIASGDLGYTPDSVESRLGEIFRLAHLWDCVLLLDEADVFLSHRDKHDLQRNALVSVFLRVLEYFNGILFLTTNRPGILDEAVKSRVHISLLYEHLGESETEDIFRLNLTRLREIEEQQAEASGNDRLYIFDDEIIDFARQHYRKHMNGEGRWNGRQIRNAFQIAASLAHYDGDVHPGAQRQLRASHFQTVDETTMKYDQYRSRIFGKLEDELAHEREERYDAFQSPEKERGGQRRASLYGADRAHSSHGHGGAAHTSVHAPSSQFQTPSSMTGYPKVTQTHGSPLPQMLSALHLPPQTPPSQRAAPPPVSSYYGVQQEQGGYTPTGIDNPLTVQQIPPVLQKEQGGYQSTGYDPLGRQQLPPLQSHDYTPSKVHQQQELRGHTTAGSYDPGREQFVQPPHFQQQGYPLPLGQVSHEPSSYALNTPGPSTDPTWAPPGQGYGG